MASSAFSVSISSSSEDAATTFHRPPPTHNISPAVCEPIYRGPSPTIPKFSNPDPSEFARLRIALENLLPVNATELFHYQILLDHLKLEEARLIADAYLNFSTPYTDTIAALGDKFGQPHQLALRKIASVLEAPEVKHGDTASFQKFSLQIQSLVGLLQTLGPAGEIELHCGSHLARLLSKLSAGTSLSNQELDSMTCRTGFGSSPDAKGLIAKSIHELEGRNQA